MISLKQQDKPCQVEISKVLSYDELIKDYDICAHSIQCSHWDMKPLAKHIENHNIVTQDADGTYKLIKWDKINEI